MPGESKALPEPGRCLVMGVLNVTPDSFSDGGRYLDRSAAVAHGIDMHAKGADMVDVGGESTRPGADRVDAATELERVVPVVTELSEAGVPVSVDTMRANVAVAAVEAGATLVNDVSGGQADLDMAHAVAECGAPWVLMHWRGHSRDMNELAVYDDVGLQVREELLRQVESAVAAGVAESQLVLDPGLGFAKTAAHDWELLRHIEAFVELGFPVLVGASRKRLLGQLLSEPDDAPRPASGRDAGTAAVSALAADRGAWGVRVHDVVASLDAVKVAAAWRGDGGFVG